MALASRSASGTTPRRPLFHTDERAPRFPYQGIRTPAAERMPGAGGLPGGGDVQLVERDQLGTIPQHGELADHALRDDVEVVVAGGPSRTCGVVVAPEDDGVGRPLLSEEATS